MKIFNTGCVFPIKFYFQSRLADTKATEEVRALEAFYKMMKNEQSRAFYGPKHVFAAVSADAIEILLISDKLIFIKSF